MKKPRCHNCKHGSKPFKIAGLTHLHCLHPKHATGLSDGTLSAWDTLREFSNGCASHAAKTPTKAQCAPKEMKITQKLIREFNFGGISRAKLSAELDNKLSAASDSGYISFRPSNGATAHYWTKKQQAEFAKYVFEKCL